MKEITEEQKTLDFGDYCTIEQLRHVGKNERYIHKVINRLRSNTWVDVPVQSPATETLHDTERDLEEVVSCICCGVDETIVRKYRVKDVKKVIIPRK
jgi:hypothetical protein